MGALEAPQDKHGQEHRTGTSRAEQTTEAMAELGALEAMAELGALEAMAELGALEAMAGRLRGLGLGPLGPAPTAGILSNPPPKISLGKLGGIRSPPGLNRQDKTGTGQPTGTGSPPGLSSEAEASSGHDEESGALTGSLSNRFHLSDKGAGGWEWPPWPLQEEPPAPDESPWT